MIWVLSLALAACVLATTAASAQAPANTPPPPSVRVGQMAPDFTATDLADANGRRQGKPVTLSEFKGQKHVVLAFFPAAFSPGCTSEMTKYQETSGQFNSNNTVILGMSVDSP
jgi:peroxiredoxin